MKIEVRTQSVFSPGLKKGHTEVLVGGSEFFSLFFGFFLDVARRFRGKLQDDFRPFLFELNFAALVAWGRTVTEELRRNSCLVITT